LRNISRAAGTGAGRRRAFASMAKVKVGYYVTRALPERLRSF